MKSLGQWLLIFVAGLLHAASWQWESSYVTAWVAWWLFGWSVSCRSRLEAAGQTILFIGLCLALAFRWAPESLAYTLNCEAESWVPYIAYGGLVLWEAAPWGIIGWMIPACKRTGRGYWFVACAMVAMESYWPRVFPWSLAHSQTEFLWFVQMAEIGGTMLMSWTLTYFCLSWGGALGGGDWALGGGNWASGSWKLHRKSCGLSAGFLVVGLVFGMYRLWDLERVEQGSGDRLRVGVIQVDPSYTDSIEKMRKRSDGLEGEVDILLWPESTLGTYVQAVESVDAMRADLDVARPPFVDTTGVKGLKSWLLVGGRTVAEGAEEEGPFYQTAFLIDLEGKIADRYHKRHLIPIGEYVPGETWFRELHDWAQLTEFTISGTSPDPVRMGEHRLGVLICYEDTVPSAARKTVVAGAEVLICLINASAFEHPLALVQHRRLAQLRSVENRRTMIRCAGTGETCVLSPTGRMELQLPLIEEGSLQVQVPLRSGWTLYQWGGHWLQELSLGVTVLGMVMGLFRGRKQEVGEEEKKKALGG